MDAGVEAAANIVKQRGLAGLDMPYGPKAAALSLGEELSPSERPGAPPGP